jgi:hypothetical protein
VCRCWSKANRLSKENIKKNLLPVIIFLLLLKRTE